MNRVKVVCRRFSAVCTCTSQRDIVRCRSPLDMRGGGHLGRGYDAKCMQERSTMHLYDCFSAWLWFYGGRHWKKAETAALTRMRLCRRAKCMAKLSEAAIWRYYFGAGGRMFARSLEQMRQIFAFPHAAHSEDGWNIPGVFKNDVRQVLKCSSHMKKLVFSLSN